MRHMLYLSSVVVLGLLAPAPYAAADDTLKLAVAQRTAWDSAAPELGQQIGIFKKHGIVLDLVSTQDRAETMQRVISGAADVGMAVSAMDVLRAYARGAPVRVIGANTSGAASYWYVLASSPIRAIQDAAVRTIAYPANGSPTHYAALDLVNQFRLKARLMLTGGTAETLNVVTSGRVDVGWAAPPFGIDEIQQGKIRVVARANDVLTIRDKTATILVTNAGALEKRKDVLRRFMDAYRETVTWMYSDPDALKRYAELAGVSEPFAQRLRDEFYTKDMLSPDKIKGLKAIMKDAVALRHIQARLSRSQLAELIQIPAPAGQDTGCRRGSVWCSLFRPVASP